MAENHGAAENRSDVLVIGGGAIGLAVAWELSRRGAEVTVLDRRDLGREASWAAAGMIPIGPDFDHLDDATPLELLAGLSQIMHSIWHERLLLGTGIDSGYRQTGAVHLAATDEAARSLHDEVDRARQLGAEVQWLSREELDEVEPALGATRLRVAEAARFAKEAQVRSPRYLQALIAACRGCGVRLVEHCPAVRLRREGRTIVGVETGQGEFVAEHVCLTAGCWSGSLLADLGGALPTRPVRGQIALLQAQPGLLRGHVCLGKRYLVPREDGLVLVGSTEEDVGFVAATTDAAIAELVDFAQQVVPALGDAKLTQAWAGLRPQSPDGLPTIGLSPHADNLWIGAGHYRGGIQLSPVTANLLADLIWSGEEKFDLSAFDPARWLGSTA